MTATAPTKRAHVLIAAEGLPTRVGLRLALEPEARCTEAADAESAVNAAVRDRPDVCLLGLDPSGQWLRVVNEIVHARSLRLRDPPHQPPRRGGVHGRCAGGRERLPDAEPRSCAAPVRGPGRSARRARRAAEVRLPAARRAEDARAPAHCRSRRQGPGRADGARVGGRRDAVARGDHRGDRDRARRRTRHGAPPRRIRRSASSASRLARRSSRCSRPKRTRRRRPRPLSSQS